MKNRNNYGTQESFTARSGRSEIKLTTDHYEFISFQQAVFKGLGARRFRSEIQLETYPARWLGHHISGLGAGQRELAAVAGSRRQWHERLGKSSRRLVHK
jgi:hypothetical protein